MLDQAADDLSRAGRGFGPSCADDTLCEVGIEPVFLHPSTAAISSAVGGHIWRVCQSSQFDGNEV